MNIILLAPPAAGKGTQAELLIDKYNFDYISTGAILRKAASCDDEFGNNLKEVLKSGKLVDDEIVLDVLKRHLDNIDHNNILLDGFPRNIYQAENLDEILRNLGSQIDYVFLLNVEKYVLIDRIIGRRLCEQCGSIYNVNIDSSKPKKDSICDKCGGSLYQRKDDNLETFKTRYDEFTKQTTPLITYYKNKNNLYEIDSSIDKEETFRQILSIIERDD